MALLIAEITKVPGLVLADAKAMGIQASSCRTGSDQEAVKLATGMID